jgi:hypothetical protein
MMTAFLDGVVDVIGIGSGKDVIGVQTVPIVTGMTSVQP